MLYSFVINKSQKAELHYEQIMCLHNGSAIKPIYTIICEVVFRVRTLTSKIIVVNIVYTFYE